MQSVLIKAALIVPDEPDLMSAHLSVILCKASIKIERKKKPTNNLTPQTWNKCLKILIKEKQAEFTSLICSSFSLRALAVFEIAVLSWIPQKSRTQMWIIQQEKLLFLLLLLFFLLFKGAASGTGWSVGKNNTLSTFADMLFIRKAFLLLLCITLFFYCWIVTTGNRPGHVIKKGRHLNLESSFDSFFLKCMKGDHSFR